MKLRESAMPVEAYWETLFDVPLILDRLGIDSRLGDVIALGSGYGAFTFFFNGNRSIGAAGGSATMFDLQLTLVYFPTAYGTTASNFTAGGNGGGGKSLTSGGQPGNDPEQIGVPLTAEGIAAEQAEAAAFHQARLERELAQMRAQMAEMQAHLEQIRREQGLVQQWPPPAPLPPRATNANIVRR